MTSSTPTNLAKFRKSQLKKKAQGKTMCQRGFHKWQDEAKKQFDVKQGRLVSMQTCSRCGASRTKVS